MFAIFELRNARKATGSQWDRAMVRVGFVVDVVGGQCANIITLGHEFGVVHGL